MSDIAIRVEGLGKQYRPVDRPPYKSLRESIMRGLAGPYRYLRCTFQSANGKPDNAHDSIWALKDVSFEVNHGEVLGIIGRNGAGKSTLLKILSRVTEPTNGAVDVFGRVGSLLEVGTGFHPELTGRENIYLNGAILGMTRREVTRKFDEIVAFAEVEKFLDMAVKRYSTGMHMRLAFAVAAHLEPELLLVDEVLAVGDAMFQKKCLGKMQDVAASGRTVLLVSHNMTAVKSLCTRALWLDRGLLMGDGPVNPTVVSYLNRALSSLTEQVWPDAGTAPGNDKVRLHSARMRPVGSDLSGELTNRMAFVIEIEFRNFAEGCVLNPAIHLFNEDGILVLASAPINERRWNGRPFPRGRFKSTCFIPGDLLNTGTHRLQVMLVENAGTVLLNVDDALVFDVREDARVIPWFGKWPGAVRPPLDWATECVEAGKSGS